METHDGRVQTLHVPEETHDGRVQTLNVPVETHDGRVQTLNVPVETKVWIRDWVALASAATVVVLTSASTCWLTTCDS